MPDDLQTIEPLESDNTQEEATPDGVTNPSQESDINPSAFFIDLSEIMQSDVFRCRECDDEETIEAYSDVFTKYKESMERGENPEYPFPPVWIWQEHGINGESHQIDPKVYTLVAGFHRFEAANKAGIDKILVRVFIGTEDDAALFAMRDNSKNGLRLNYGDLKFCVEKALKRFSDRTPGAIAKDLGCSRTYAYKIESELSTSGQLTKRKKRRGADGRVRSAKRKATQPPPESNPNPASDAQPSDEPESVAEPFDESSVENEAETILPLETSEEQSRSIEEQIDDFFEHGNRVWDTLPNDDERVRLFDRIINWADTKVYSVLSQE
jgi:hypothetical protein